MVSNYKQIIIDGRGRAAKAAHPWPADHNGEYTTHVSVTTTSEGGYQ
jgi:hypothetical protein